MNKKLLKYSAIPAIIGLLLGWSDWAIARDVIESDDCGTVHKTQILLPNGGVK